MKFHKNYQLSLILCYECLSLTGEIIIKSVEHKIHLETLIAMGKELQKDLYQSLLEELDLMFENDSDIIGVMDYYSTLRYAGKHPDTIHLPLSNQIENKLTILEVSNDVFIPEFRINLGQNV